MTIKDSTNILERLKDLEKAVKSRLENNLDVIELEIVKRLKRELYYNTNSFEKYINFKQYPIHKKSIPEKMKFLEEILPFDAWKDDIDEIPTLECIGEELAFYKQKYQTKAFDDKAFNEFFFEAFYRR